MADRPDIGVYDPRPPTPVTMPTVDLIAPTEGEPFPLVDGEVLVPDETTRAVTVPCHAVLELLAVGFTYDNGLPPGLAPAAAQADSVASDVAGLVADFNALLAKLRTAKLLAE